MKNWKKITIAVGIILIIVAGYLYIRGYENVSQTSDEETESPLFPTENNNSGGFFAGNEIDTATENNVNSEKQNSYQSQLWQITDEMIAGNEWVSGEEEEVIWFVNRSNGHIFSTRPEDRSLTRVTNTTIPQVYEALIASDGQYVVYRYLNDSEEIKTYVANLYKSTENESIYQVNGSFLPDDVSTISISPDGKKVFYLQPNVDGVVGVIHTLETGNSVVVFESTAREWRSEWTKPEYITIYTSADTNVTGFAYEIGTNGDLRKIAEGLGLTAHTGSDEKYILLGRQESGQYRVELQNEQGTTLMTPPTLGEKCGWSSQTNFFLCGVPESLPSNPLKTWYQGRSSLNDQLVLFDPMSRNQEALLDNDHLNKGPFDIDDIKINKTSNTVMFTDRHTGTLWGFALQDSKQ